MERIPTNDATNPVAASASGNPINSCRTSAPPSLSNPVTVSAPSVAAIATVAMIEPT